MPGSRRYGWHEEVERGLHAAHCERARLIRGLDLSDPNHDASTIEGVGADAIADRVEPAIGAREPSGIRRPFRGSVVQKPMGSVEIGVKVAPRQE